MLFGQKLLLKRKELCYSAATLSQKCGISRSYITLIENGQRLPGKKIIPQLALALNLKNSAIISWYLDEIREKLQ